MKVELYLVFTVSVLVSTQATMLGECEMAGFYRELGCKMMSEDTNTTSCPEAFVCPDLHPDPKKCFYRGVAYNDRDLIPQELVENPCSQQCICTVSEDTRFQCAAVDCVETFDSDMEQCINTYDLGSCCYTGTVCGKDDIAKLKTCEVDGRSYKEGEQIYPKDTHKTCLCTAQWNGSFEDPSYCRDINCGIEIHFQDMISQKCAPVYYGLVRDCPIEFKCPSISSKIIRGVNVRNISSQCIFGNMTLQVGDEVTVDAECMKCSCKVPPFLTCVQSQKNDKDNSC